MKTIPGWTAEEILELATSQMIDLENPGICIECGQQADGCEPDARRYRCAVCGARAVYGASELLMMGYAG